MEKGAQGASIPYRLFVVMTLLIGTTLGAAQTAALPADDTPPVIDLVDSEGRTLVNGTVYAYDDVTIYCLVLDDISEIEEVEYSIDGSVFKPTAINDDIHRTSVDLSGLADGAHILTVRAVNSASLVSERSVGFSIDSTAAPSDDSLTWNALGAIVAISGISIALAFIILNRKKGPQPKSLPLRDGEIPPIL